MDIQELLARLDRHRGSFPGNLVAEVIARRQEVIPRFLEILEEIDRSPGPWLADDGRMIHIYALYLLALFRETGTYPLLVRIFSRPGEFPFELAGDVVTQDLGRILASVSGGDFSGLTALIENEQANEYVRSVAMEGMVSLVTTRQRTRDEVVAYFLQLFKKLERNPGAQWDGLAHVCADLWPQEAIDELGRAYEEGLVDTGSIDWQDIEHAQALGQQGAMKRARYRDPLITDVAKNMGWMQCFRKAERDYEGEGDAEEDLPESLSSGYTTVPVRRTQPKVGRNERCPCGSGKKFKKCCGAG
ncbi:MAG: DUF1186 domain-containing protein [Terriglobales bacterium]|jgi:hypothetical protein